MLLSGTVRPDEFTAGLRAVADLLAALRAPAGPGETSGWADALTLYRANGPATRPLPEIRVPEIGVPEIRPATRRPRLLGSLRGVKVAVAAALLMLVGGSVAAAYTGSLPASLQRFAHEMIAAPNVVSSTAPSAPGRQGHKPGSSAKQAGTSRAPGRGHGHGLPPGHGGVPPGHGGVPPGQVGNPGHTGKPPAAPGNSHHSGQETRNGHRKHM